MTFGDIEDDPVIKLGFMPRSSKAALRNLTKFYADTMTIAGDVQAPVDRIEFYAHRALVNAKNLHAQLQANDSGVAAPDRPVRPGRATAARRLDHRARTASTSMS